MLKIPVSKPEITEQCKAFAYNAIQDESISGLFGSFINKFETEFAKFTGVKHAITCSNGTTAIHLALICAGVRAGDEVLVSTTTNMATFFAVEYIGALPIPVDINLNSLTMDPEDLIKKITSKTKAILCVHLFGQLCEMDALVNIAENYKLKLIEDCAEAHGASFNGKFAGSFGEVGAFSFFSNKLLTCGEGGIVTTNDDEIAKRARSLRSLAFGETNKFLHTETGYNYRLSNIACAIGYSQTMQANELISGRKHVCEQYIEQFSQISEIIAPPVIRASYVNVYWMAHFTLLNDWRDKRNELLDNLKKKGIETRVGFVPYHLQTYHKRFRDFDPCPNATSLAYNTFYLPTFNSITDEELNYTAQTVLELLN